MFTGFLMETRPPDGHLKYVFSFKLILELTGALVRLSILPKATYLVSSEAGSETQVGLTSNDRISSTAVCCLTAQALGLRCK